MGQKYVFLMVVFSLFAFVQAQSTNSGLAFLKLPVDARSAAMGEAATANVNDATAIYWNPALLTKNNTKNVVLMHNAYLADITQEFVAFQFALGKHNLALALNFMNIPGIEIRGNRPTQQPAGTTEAINLAASFGYARFLKNDWAIGASIKYLYEKYYLESATGWALDFGLFKKEVYGKSLDWGLTLQNLGAMNRLSVESTRLPLIMRSGFLYRTPFLLNGQNINTTFDFIYLLRDGRVNLSGGLEARVIKALFLRGGLIFDWEKLRYSAGFGLHFKKYQFNYAFSPYPYNLGNSHRFSLSWWF